MKRNETRYKGVWSAGHAEAMRQANKVLWQFVNDGGQLSANSGKTWDLGSVGLRLDDRIAVAPPDGIIIGMEILLARSEPQEPR